MARVAYTELRRNLSRYLDEAAASGTPIVVTRPGKADVVMMSEAEFAGWQETVRLLGSPRNAERLLESIRELESGRSEAHELIQPD